jgi:hypothetical protein
MVLSVPLSFAAAQDASASLRGTVIDSIRRAPLVGATVIALRAATNAEADARDYSATTDAHGKFAINALPPGLYMVTVEHPWLDSTGFGVPPQKADLIKEHSATVNLAVPSGATIRSVFCASTAADSSVGLVAGYVKDAQSDRPVQGIRVVFAWSDFEVDRRTAQATPRDRAVAATTDRDGMFRMCGVPVLRTLSMQAQFGDHKATGIIETIVPSSGVLVETIRFDPNARGTVALNGAIRDEVSQQRIAGAHVHLVGTTGEIVTERDGVFHLIDVPLGTQSIEVTALGYAPRRYTLELKSGQVDDVIIGLAETGTVLDSVKIRGAKRSAFDRNREFDERSAHGAGQYITEAMIEKASVLESSELLQQVHGYYVMQDTVYSSRGVTALGSNDPKNPANRVCKPKLYVDGTYSDRMMNDIAPGDIHGIEIYASGTLAPPQYKSGLCGVILIWTK